MRSSRGPGRPWSRQEDRTLRGLFPHASTNTVARILGRTPCSVSARAGVLGLCKTAEYLASPAACRLRRGDNVGASTRFKKGHIPANKGLRRPGYAPGRMAQSQFKAGQKGSNWVPIGSTRTVDGYQYTKVRDIRCVKGGRGFVPYTVNWKPTHVVLWQKRRGRIPRGHVLIFRDGDRTNIRLRNLRLISRQELMRRNSVHNLPKPLREVIQLRGALVRQLRRRTA